MIPKLHAAAGSLALLTIATFWSSTIVTELFGSHVLIAQTKALILWEMMVLVPAVATAGATEAALSKSRRMKIIAANGLLILLPSAVFLALRAGSGQFDAVFYSIQAVELIAGATNITLLTANLRDGMAMAARRKTPA